MAAYLIVDLDDLLGHFRSKSVFIDLQELAVGLRGGAALAAGLASADKLKAIVVASWDKIEWQRNVNPRQIFITAGYEDFDAPPRGSLADAVIMHYFSYDPEPVNELILATTSRDLLPVIRRVKTTRNARIRMWGSEDVLQGTEFAEDVVFQPLETLLGIQTKNVAVYIDFENIAISLNEQGFVVNLDHLVNRFVTQAKAHGMVVKMAAYAPWGQRGSLPPLVDTNGREIADEAPSRLMVANIDPVFNLPGKNSADVRIARDVITDAGHSDAADVYILASGDRDFNDVLNTLMKRGLTVIVWGVRGSTSRILEKNSNITVEYIDDFTDLQTHQSLGSAMVHDEIDDFIPSQWTSVILQFDALTAELNTETVSIRQLVEQLQKVGAVISRPRGEDLVSQSISLGLLKPISTNGHIILNDHHPIVDKTRLIADRIAHRVENTLQVRGWEYVNYGFLLKGLAMDQELERPGMNADDQWRSHWIDALVREGLLERQLVPHRHNSDDLVPVIKLCDVYPFNAGIRAPMTPMNGASSDDMDWESISIPKLYEMEPDTATMVVRVIVSIEQFTSFRDFEWCPLGSLHRRLRAFDTGMSFQRAVEYLSAHDAALVQEYHNPQSDYMTKGISVNMDNVIVQKIIEQRDAFICVLLSLYDRNMIVSEQGINTIDPQSHWNLDLWFSIMETENVLNALPGRHGQYSLFRTHHSVNIIAERC